MSTAENNDLVRVVIAIARDMNTLESITDRIGWFTVRLFAHRILPHGILLRARQAYCETAVLLLSVPIFRMRLHSSKGRLAEAVAR